ncbi:MAG: DNA-protecting protein DprA [Ignavibacteriales bacterium]|nr:DNA-protecting protein DprA [Ignavibacteriales bacterium]
MFDVRDLLRLAAVPRIGHQKIRSLVSHFKDPAAVFKASPRELTKVPGIVKDLAVSIAHQEDGEAFADDQLRRLNKLGGRIITIWEKGYPELLKKIYDPPAYLFVLGEFAETDRYSIAIVGTRMASSYGKIVAENFSKELARLGITTVSGLARGIDTIVHSSTLKANGRTIAVIGSGLDVPYPPENLLLLERIAKQGVVISEFLMGTSPDATNFPRRNRIISGLSLGTVVIESAENGGAMITASTALDQNREVFAVPGRIHENRSRGPNKLIQEGRAKLVLTVEDILDELKQQLKEFLTREHEPEPAAELTLFELKILDVLRSDATHIDTIAEDAQISPADTLVNLLSLEFKGLVKQMPGKMFVKL